MSVRLQKYLAQRGIASRRGAAAIIAAGRVHINGARVTEPGAPVTPEDRVSVDGHPLPDAPERRITIVLHKPRGYICSTNQQQGRTVYDLLDGVTERVVPVGRLDKDSEGLLILSNDGDLVLRLTHPSHEHTKRYRVEVAGHITREALGILRSPIEIEDYTTRPAHVALEQETPGGALLSFELTEGRNRQIRRLCAAAGLDVLRLIRVSSGPIDLAQLPPGSWRELTTAEIEALAPTRR